RKQREHVVRDAALLARERREAGLEIFLHGEQRKNFSALRHVGDAAARALVRLEAGDVGARGLNGGAAPRMLPPQPAQQAGLADTVAAEHAGHLAGFGRELDTAQRLGGAVVQIDGFYVEHDYSVSVCAAHLRLVMAGLDPAISLGLARPLPR